MRPVLTFFGILVAAFLTLAMLYKAGWTHPPIEATQAGFRGTGMAQIANPAAQRVLKAANVLPDVIDPASPDGQRATEAYQNVQVLTDLSADQFNRVMLAITDWVAPKDGPQAGCAYCHNVENMADDSLYTKKVARRMLQMTRTINKDWQHHVAATGVTCYTCHRGMPVPANVWFKDPGQQHLSAFVTSNYGFGHPNKAAGSTELPTGLPLLDTADAIRVNATQAFPKPHDPGASIQSAEHTYALMIHMSQSLGVNCAFCHNTRAFSLWDQSSPPRVPAWHGIRMVRDLNTNYLEPLQSVFPEKRLGPLGDVPKINCATCHQGVNKPLNGVSMAKDYPELGGIKQP
jgi:photosynthetic reaction center cytochrome c subunit